MKKTIKYTDESFGDIKIVDDFLPSAKNLILRKEENVKVTISLTKESIDFFKEEAKKQHIQYKNIIKNLLDVYANQHTNRLANN